MATQSIVVTARQRQSLRTDRRSPGARGRRARAPLNNPLCRIVHPSFPPHRAMSSALRCPEFASRIRELTNWALVV